MAEQNGVKISVSKIKNAMIRRLVIVGTFPVVLSCGYIWAAVQLSWRAMTLITDIPLNLLRSASKVW